MRRKIAGFLTALILLIGCCGATVQAAMPAEPTSGAGEWVLQQDFEGYNNGASITKWWQSQGSVRELSGNRVLSVYHNVETGIGATAEPYFYPVPIQVLETPIATDFLVYKARVMIPNVAPAGEPVYAGGRPCIAFWSDNLSTYENHFIALGITANKGQNRGKIESFPKMESVGDSVPCDILPDTWYELMLVADVVNGRADAYLNDKLMFTEIPFATEASSIGSIAVLPTPNAATTVPEGYLLGTNVRTTKEELYRGNPYPAYVDDIRVFRANQTVAVDYTKAGLDAVFDVEMVNGEIALPFATWKKSWEADKSFRYASENSAIRLSIVNGNEINLDTDLSNPNEKPKATVTRPLYGTGNATGNIQINFKKGNDSFTHTIPLTVQEDSKYLPISPEETGVNGYLLFEDFETCVTGVAIPSSLMTRHWWCEPTAAEIDGNTVAAMTCAKDESATNAPGAIKLRNSADSGYVVLRAQVMLPTDGATANISLSNKEMAGALYVGAADLTNVKIRANTADETGYIAVSCASYTKDSTPTPTEISKNIRINTWYTVEIVADITSGQFDVLFDGVPVVTDAYFQYGDAVGNVVRSVSIGSADEYHTVYFDDLTVRDVTGAYALGMLQQGFKNLFGNGCLVGNVELPRFGWTNIDDCHYTLSLAGSNDGSMILRQKLIDNPGNPNESYGVDVVRPAAYEENKTATITVEYSNKFGVDYNASEIPITLMKELYPVGGYPGIEVGDLTLTKVGDAYKGEIQVVNGSSTDLVCKMKICFYQNGVYMDMEQSVLTVPKGNKLPVSFTSVNTHPGATQVKAFLWAPNGIKALAKAAKY